MPKPWRALRQPERITRAFPTVTDRVVAPLQAPAADAADTADAPSLDRLVRDARREAFEEGRAAGRQEAAASIDAARRARVEQLATEIAHAARAAATMREEVVDEVGRDVAGLVVDLAEVLVESICEGQRTLRDRIVRALALAPQGPELVIRVNADAGLSDDEIRALTSGVAVEVVRDPSVDATGCVVTVGSCKIDGQVSSALDRVRRELAGAR